MTAVRLVTRMMALDFLAELGLRRWLVVPPGFALLTYLLEISIIYDPERHANRPFSAWDLVPAFLVNRAGILWGFALGFVLLVGDGLTRARAHGMTTPALVRAPSRALWWAARLGTVGLQALFFTAIAMVAIWLVGASHLPVSPEHSPAALGLDGSSDEYYPVWLGVPMPVFVLASGAYAALVLWLLGCLLMTVSLVFRQPFVPLFVGVGWVFASTGLLFKVFEERAWTWNLANLISYSKHLRVGQGAMPLSTFLAGAAVLLTAVFLLGAFWLQERDI